MINLTKDEKKQIVEARIKGLNYKKYGIQMDVLVENARNNPSEEAIANLNEALEEIDNQLSVLDSELTTINALEE